MVKTHLWSSIPAIRKSAVLRQRDTPTPSTHALSLCEHRLMAVFRNFKMTSNLPESDTQVAINCCYSSFTRCCSKPRFSSLPSCLSLMPDSSTKMIPQSSLRVKTLPCMSNYARLRNSTTTMAVSILAGGVHSYQSVMCSRPIWRLSRLQLVIITPVIIKDEKSTQLPPKLLDPDPGGYCLLYTSKTVQKI